MAEQLSALSSEDRAMNPPQRPMTVLLAHVSGSVRLFEQLAEAEATQAMARCLRQMTECVDRRRGRTVQITGAELLAVFAASDDACQAAVAMQERIGGLAPLADNLKLAIRVGLHRGLLAESDPTPSSATVLSTARIAGLATREQILVSSALLEALPGQALDNALFLPVAGTVNEGEAALQLFEINWRWPDEDAAAPAPVPPRSGAGRFCVRYHGQAFHLDGDHPVLTLGRDPANALLVEERKASRRHGKIERRAAGYFYVDASSNGSFIRFAGQTESLLRHDEILLHGSGRICFGKSGNDPSADCLEFEAP